jgi:hypothetical protein
MVLSREKYATLLQRARWASGVACLKYVCRDAIK